MNISQCEGPVRVFSSADANELPSVSAKEFAESVQSGVNSREVIGAWRRALPGMAGTGTFNRFAFKALPWTEQGGVGLSAHLSQPDETFKRAWSIYTEAFVDFERRSFLEQQTVMARPRYRFSAIRQGAGIVGMLGYWQLPGFCFIEHFAIASSCRSGGLGRRVIRMLQANSRQPIVLDVEPFGSDHSAARRVAFYTRLGFHYCARPVTLPPYAGKETEPSNLMAWPKPLDDAGRALTRSVIEREVYGLPTFVPWHRAG